MFTRRQILQQSALVSLSSTIPAFLRTVKANPTSHSDRILIVVQLSGGNDGLNTLVPFQDDGYAAARKTLRLPEDRLIKLDDRFALHPEMKAFAELIQDGRAAIVQGVGYPDPNRSHDVSMSVWQTGRTDVELHRETGWLGRALDAETHARTTKPDAVSTASAGIPTALRGRKSRVASIRTLDELQFDGGLDAAEQTRQSETVAASKPLVDFMRRAQLDAYATSEQLRALSQEGRRRDDSQLARMDNPLAQQLSVILSLIQADFGPRVYYAEHVGYDTHYDQLQDHAQLLGELSRSLSGLMRDLRTSGLEERVLVLCFSEFGRQVHENASGGTDHGTAGPVMLVGKAVRPGIHGTPLDLANLTDNAPRFTLDFRDVYAGILHKWLASDAKAVLDGHATEFTI